MASIEAARKNNLNDRARKAGRPADEQLSTQDIDTLISFYDYTCLKCGTKPANSPDHVIPLSKGGTNTLSNLELLCTSCNKAKQDDEIDYRKGLICPDDLHQEQERKDRRIIHDWDEIETDYILGDSTLRDLSREYKVSLSHIGEVASRDDWSGKRQNYRNKIGTQIRAEIEALNVADGFSTYKAFYVSMRRAFDDFILYPTPEKLRALDELYSKGLVMEGRDELNTKKVVFKDWQDVAGKDTTPIQDFADTAAETYYSGGDSGEDRESGAGWTD